MCYKVYYKLTYPALYKSKSPENFVSKFFPTLHDLNIHVTQEDLKVK